MHTQLLDSPQARSRTKPKRDACEPSAWLPRHEQQQRGCVEWRRKRHTPWFWTPACSAAAAALCAGPHPGSVFDLGACGCATQALGSCRHEGRQSARCCGVAQATAVRHTVSAYEPRRRHNVQPLHSCHIPPRTQTGSLLTPREGPRPASKPGLVEGANGTCQTHDGCGVVSSGDDEYGSS